MNKRHAIVETEQGELTVAAADDAIVGVYFPGHWTMPPAGSLGEEVGARTDALIEVAGNPAPGVPRRGPHLVRAADHDGRRRVPGAGLGDAEEIPFGETTTYGEIAEKLGDRTLARSVGQAVGRNPLSIIVGCHRVVGKDGKLTGFAGGLKRKRALLELEAPSPVEAGRCSERGFHLRHDPRLTPNIPPRRRPPRDLYRRTQPRTTNAVATRERGSRISRTRLTARMGEALASGGVLVTAGAGYGKTTLLDQALGEAIRPVAWISCSETERSPEVAVDADPRGDRPGGARRLGRCQGGAGGIARAGGRAGRGA